MATTVGTHHQNRRFILIGSIVAATAIGAYGLGRVYPPRGPSAGTITAGDRYIQSQVDASAVTLGDTSVASLVQTDAFRILSKDANFQALAKDPSFAAAASNPALMQAIAADPKHAAARTALGELLLKTRRDDEAIATAVTVHAYLEAATGRPRRPPEWVRDISTAPH